MELTLLQLVPLSYLVPAGTAAVAFLLGYLLGGGKKASQLVELRAEARRFEASAERNRLAVDELRERLANATQNAESLEQSLRELPEIAQRLSGTRDLRQIPDSALDLVHEIFVPSYSVFYRISDGGLVAVATRGETPFPIGHRVQIREGVVGWAALRQMAVNQFEVQGLAIGDQFDVPDFSLCLPVVNGLRTLGVILIGPTAREMPRAREMGRTIALITAVTIAHTQILREQEMLAMTDGLTGLLNRTHVIRTLEEMVGSTNSFPRISLFLFDVDHFKHYNDTNGHLLGDELLKSLANLLRLCVRDGEFVGRYGGEEFLLVMPGVDVDDAQAAADRIREQIAEQAFPNGVNQPLGAVTISGGVATWPTHGEQVAEVLQHADEALYAAKHGGRNSVLTYRPPKIKPSADGRRSRARKSGDESETAES